jgi:hypothetical protein
VGSWKSSGFFVPDSDIDDAFNNEIRNCSSSERVLDDDAAGGEPQNRTDEQSAS